MATDATGTPTTNFSIPKYNPDVDAPSGLGFNAAMDAIDAALDSVRDSAVVLTGSPVAGEVPVWTGAVWDPQPIASTRTVRVPIYLSQPDTSGNAYPVVVSHTDWVAQYLGMKTSVAGSWYGSVLVPTNLAATPNAKIKVGIAANATTGVTRLQVGTSAIADGESLNPAALTDETAQDVTVPATAYLRKDVSFTLTNAPSASDILIVQVYHDGAHANDTLAVDTLLAGAWLEVDVT